jgi:dihydroceramidase
MHRSLSNNIEGYYHYLQDPTFHQNVYAILSAIVVFRSMYVMEINIRPSLRNKYGRVPPNTDGKIISQVGNAEDAERDKQILRDMWLMIALGLTIFLGGFGIWNLDNFYCSTIRHWRRGIGLPWGILLEGHGWW